MGSKKPLGASTKFLAVAGLAVGIAISASAVDGMISRSPEPVSTSLQEFMKMDDSAQKTLIIEKQRDLLDKFKVNDLERAECIANIFNGGESGIERFRSIKGILKEAANRNIDKTAEDMTEIVITNKFCPETTFTLK